MHLVGKVILVGVDPKAAYTVYESFTLIRGDMQWQGSVDTHQLEREERQLYRTTRGVLPRG